MKKVLIFYASYGGGHLSAAKSIKQYIDENYNDVQTEMIDCIKYVDKAFEKITTSAYLEMAKNAPWAWKKVYDNAQEGILGKISNDANKLMSKKIAKLFDEFKPDIVISTHPFSSQMTTILKKKKKTNCVLATVLTDFVSHDQWLVNSEYVDYFFVSNEKMKEQMVNEKNIDENKIFVTGIPISKRFLEKHDKNAIYNEFQLSSKKKTILFFGGGEFGIGKARTVAILDILAKSKADIQVVAISGKNQKMENSFNKVVINNNKQDSIKVFSYTSKVPELMAIANLVITKPGGLTTSESLASGLPIIAINPIPGQEEENAKFLENSGAAIWLRKKMDPARVINSVLNEDNKLKDMQNNSIKIASKYSTENICKICLDGKENNDDK